MKNRTADMPALLPLLAQRRALDGLGEQHLLGEDQIGARVVRELVVVAHGDRVERTGHLAVAAEDAAAEVDLVDGGVALAGRDAQLGRVLGRHDTDAVRRAGRRAERAADALLQARVLEAVQLVPAAEAWVDRRLLLGVLDRDRALDDSPKGRPQTTQGLAEGSVCAGGRAAGRPALDLHDVGTRIVRRGHVSTTRIAVTSRLR